MAANFLKLFYDKRLSPREPEHLSYIKGRLAAIKMEDPASYEHWSMVYGVDIDVKVTKEPEVQPEEVTMTKKEIIAALKEAGQEVDETQKKAELLEQLTSL